MGSLQITGLITNLPAEKITINKLNINVLITDITLKKIAVHFLPPLHFNFPFLLVQFPLQFSPFYHCDSNQDPVCSVLILIYLTPCSSFYFAQPKAGYQVSAQQLSIVTDLLLAHTEFQDKVTAVKCKTKVLPSFPDQQLDPSILNPCCDSLCPVLAEGSKTSLSLPTDV